MTGAGLQDAGDEPPAIEIRGLRSQFGSRVIHENLDLTVERGEILGVVGGSGSGKSVMLNTIIGLKRPEGGSVRVFGHDIHADPGRNWGAIERRWGVLFQQGALFSNLTVAENVEAPLAEPSTEAAPTEPQPEAAEPEPTTAPAEAPITDQPPVSEDTRHP